MVLCLQMVPSYLENLHCLKSRSNLKVAHLYHFFKAQICALCDKVTSMPEQLIPAPCMSPGELRAPQ